MKNIFSDHAKEQLVERKIPKKIVLETVKNPQKKINSYKNRELRQRKFGSKILEVVIIEEDNSIIIITQYWLEKEYN